VVTDIRTIFYTDAGRLTVTDNVLRGNVSESISGFPRGSLHLPLKRDSQYGRVPYSDLIRPGDLCLVEMQAWKGSGPSWQTVLHGVVTDVQPSETVVSGKYQSTTAVSISSMIRILERDQLAKWMYLGSVEGWEPMRSRLLPDQMNTQPHLVAYEYLKRIAFDSQTYNNGAGLDGYLHLDFAGLNANAPLEYKLAMSEGSHISIINQFLDSPIHELYGLTTTPDLFMGDSVHTATNTPGINQGATTLRWRKAPYPYANEAGSPVMDEWEALPVHDFESDLTPIGSRAGGYSDAAVRNFFLMFPNYQFANEYFMYAIGAAVKNQYLINRFGYSPLKVGTNLVINSDETSKETIEEFMLKLSWRVAGQWNNMHRYENGSVTTMLAPHIRTGDRLRAPNPWTGKEVYEYHVQGRSLDWTPSERSTTLMLERGLPETFYREGEFFVNNLTAVRVGSDTYSNTFRAQDVPGN
jgi:hypothetical protein